jgi:hypothetical protein
MPAGVPHLYARRSIARGPALARFVLAAELVTVGALLICFHGFATQQ